MSNIVSELIQILKEVGTLQRPVTATGVAAFVLAVVPGVNVSAGVLVGILVAVGGAAAFVEKFVVKHPLLKA